MSEVTPETGRDIIDVSSDKRAPGRPPVHTDEVMLGICNELANGGNLIAICDKEGAPDKRTFFRWVMDTPNVQSQYRIAVLMRREAFVDEILHLAADCTHDWITVDSGDNTPPVKEFNKDHFRRVKLRIDTLFRLLERGEPKKYTDEMPESLFKPNNGDNAKPVTQAPTVIENDPLHDAINAWRKVGASG